MTKDEFIEKEEFCNEPFCYLYKKRCIGGICSVTPCPQICKHLKPTSNETP